MIKLRKGILWKGALVVLACLSLIVVATARHGDRVLYPAGSDRVTVYVINNGFHTDIVLPADKVTARGGLLAQAGRAVGPHRYWVYGWGDAGFFAGSGVSPARAADGARAMFWPGNSSVIRVYGVDPQEDKTFDAQVMTVALSPAGFDALARHIEASLVAGPKGAVRAAVGDPTSVFFESREHFSALRTCNNWASDQLAAAGLPTTPVVDGLAPLLALDLRLRAHLKG